LPVFLDTNILLYSITTRPEEEKKKEQARSILRRSDCVVSVQVLQEFYAQSTRPSRPKPLGHEQAFALVEAWTRFSVVENDLKLLMASMTLRAATGYSIWDCLIIAAAQAGGCQELFTEDLSHGRVIEGVTVVNPFR
jgi:predicted nucleic acid-binding protein